VSVRSALQLGTSPDGQVVLDGTGIAPVHAFVRHDGDEYVVEQAGSGHDTFVNGVRTSRAVLRHLDVITLGASTDLVYVQSDRAIEQPVQRTVSGVRIEWTAGAARPPLALARGEFTVGRTSASDVVIDLPEVSREHARLVVSASGVRLIDLGSANGTRLRGTRVTTPTEVLDGDELQIGAVRLRVRVVAGDADAAASVAAGAELADGEWKTRLVWPSEELAALQVALQSGDGPPSRGTERDPRGLVSIPPVTDATAPDAPIRSVHLLGDRARHSHAHGRWPIGRAPDAGVRIDSQEVSRVHAVIVITGTDATITDQNSVNGCTVNDIALTTPRRLAHGDRLGIASFSFRIEIERRVDAV
jgi:pSer/pThr/pTyr-binding forkhead associated (FHA) protein